MTQTVDIEKAAAAVGRIPGGIYIATAEIGDEKVGMLASWVQQAGFEPLSVVIAVKPDRELFRAIEATGTFTLNVLGEKQNALMKPFTHFKPDQFDEVSYRKSECGLVLNDAVAYIDCKKSHVINVGDHTLVVGTVVGGEVLNEELAPWTHVRKSGLNY